MDFSTMRKKIQQGEYQDAEAFRHDFNLVMSNAKIYNARETIYWKSADKMEDVCNRMIDRTAKQIEEEKLNNNNEEYTDRKLSMSLSARKDSFNVKEEDIDIMGFDTSIPTLRKQSRQDSVTRETSVDLLSSRAMTPIRTTPYKKKKKKPAETGVLYGPDGSLHTVGGGK